MNLAHLSPEERSGEIEHLGRLLKQLSKMNIPNLEDKDHDPFTGIDYSISTGDTQNEIDEDERWHEDQKIKLLVDFCKLKRSQIGMLKAKRKSSLESKSSVSSNSTKEKGRGFFDKTWKKILAIVGGFGIIVGTIISILDLWDRLTGTNLGS